MKNFTKKEIMQISFQKLFIHVLVLSSLNLAACGKQNIVQDAGCIDNVYKTLAVKGFAPDFFDDCSKLPQCSDQEAKEIVEKLVGQVDKNVRLNKISLDSEQFKLLLDETAKNVGLEDVTVSLGRAQLILDVFNECVEKRD